MERYGFQPDSFWRIEDVRYESASTRWKVLRDGREFAEFEFALAGEYNVLNATAAAALAHGHGISAETIAGALREFRSVKRRLEVRAEVGGITVIDDFAHHPTAIGATLGRCANASRTAAVGDSEPRSNTLRRNVFQRELVESLALADQVVVASVFFKATDALKPEERLDVERVVGELNERGVAARQLPDVAAIVEYVAAQAAAGDVLAILSNGGFGGIYEKLPAALEQGRHAEDERLAVDGVHSAAGGQPCGHAGGAACRLLVSCAGRHVWNLSEACRARGACGCGDAPARAGVSASGVEWPVPGTQFCGERERVKAFEGVPEWMCDKCDTGDARAEKIDKTTWRISSSGDYPCVTFSYDILTNDPGPFGSSLDGQHGFFNWAEVLVYRPDQRSAPVSLRIVDAPAGGGCAMAECLACAAPGS